VRQDVGLHPRHAQADGERVGRLEVDHHGVPGGQGEGNGEGIPASEPMRAQEARVAGAGPGEQSQHVDLVSAHEALHRAQLPDVA
jgi:hypothetical protein